MYLTFYVIVKKKNLESLLKQAKKERESSLLESFLTLLFLFLEKAHSACKPKENKVKQKKRIRPKGEHLFLIVKEEDYL